MVPRDTNLAAPSHFDESGDADRTLGRKMRQIRKARGLSLQTVAQRAGLSVGLISQIERGLTSPSIRSLRQLGAALDVPVEQFFTLTEPPEAYEEGHIVRPRHRRVLDLPHTGITIELISPDSSGALQMFIANIEPGGASGPELDVHEGEEAGLVLAGRLELWLGDKHYLLDQGDSFRFSSATPHRYGNPGIMTARIQWVITPPIY